MENDQKYPVGSWWEISSQAPGRFGGALGTVEKVTTAAGITNSTSVHLRIERPLVEAGARVPFSPAHLQPPNISHEGAKLRALDLLYKYPSTVQPGEDFKAWEFPWSQVKQWLAQRRAVVMDPGIGWLGNPETPAEAHETALSKVTSRDYPLGSVWHVDAPDGPFHGRLAEVRAHHPNELPRVRVIMPPTVHHPQSEQAWLPVGLLKRTPPVQPNTVGSSPVQPSLPERFPMGSQWLARRPVYRGGTDHLSDMPEPATVQGYLGATILMRYDAPAADHWSFPNELQPVPEPVVHPLGDGVAWGDVMAEAERLFGVPPTRSTLGRLTVEADLYTALVQWVRKEGVWVGEVDFMNGGIECSGEATPVAALHRLHEAIVAQLGEALADITPQGAQDTPVSPRGGDRRTSGPDPGSARQGPTSCASAVRHIGTGDMGSPGTGGHR